MKSELEIQRDICVAIWNELPETRYCLYHVKNELDRAMTQAELIKYMQQKASGFIEGIQDLHFIWNQMLWLIELKDDEGKISPAQKVIHAAHDGQGMKTYVFKESTACIDFVKFIVNNSHLPTHKYIPFTEILQHVFNNYISPYSNYEKLNQYIDEYEAWKEHQKELRRKGKLKKANLKLRN